MFSLEWGHGLWRSLVSALDWGSRGREFKSPQPDHKCPGQRREIIPPKSAYALAVAYPVAYGSRGGMACSTVNPLNELMFTSTCIKSWSEESQ